MWKWYRSNHIENRLYLVYWFGFEVHETQIGWSKGQSKLFGSTKTKKKQKSKRFKVKARKNTRKRKLTSKRQPLSIEPSECCLWKCFINLQWMLFYIWLFAYTYVYIVQIYINILYILTIFNWFVFSALSFLIQVNIMRFCNVHYVLLLFFHPFIFHLVYSCSFTFRFINT